MTWHCVPGFPVHHQLPESTQTQVHWVGDGNQTSHPLSSSSHLLLPSVFPRIRVLSNESALHISFPKYWSFSFNISPSNEHPGLISFRMDWLHLFAFQGTLRSLLHTTVQNINCLAVIFLYNPNLTPLHNYWKNRSLDYTDLCWQSNVSAF